MSDPQAVGRGVSPSRLPRHPFSVEVNETGMRPKRLRAGGSLRLSIHTLTEELNALKVRVRDTIPELPALKGVTIRE